MEKVKVPEDVYIVFIPSNPPPKAIITNDGLRVLKYLQKKEVIELWDKEKEEYRFFIAYSPRDRVAECFDMTNKLGSQSYNRLRKMVKGWKIFIASELSRPFLRIECSNVDDAARGLNLLNKILG